MSDQKTEALVVPRKEDKPALPRKMHEDAFVPKVKLRMTDGSVVLVPRDADANKNQAIILAEVVRNFVSGQIKSVGEKGRVLTPQEIKELVTAAKLANDMSIVAHEDIFVPTEKGGKASGSATGTLMRAVEAAAKGVASGNAEANQKAIERFMSLGKKEKKAGSIDVVATPVT